MKRNRKVKVMPLALILSMAAAGPQGPAERAEKREVYAMKTVIPIFIVLLYMLFFGWN